MAILRFLLALHLRLTGLVLLASVAAGLVGPALAAPADPSIPSAPLWSLAARAGLGLFLLVPWWLPRALRRPARVRDLLWLAVPAAAAALHAASDPGGLVLLLSMTGLPADVTAAISGPFGASVLLAPPVLLMPALILSSRRSPGQAGRSPGAVPAPMTPERRLAVPKLPALGPAMKLYVVADWTILRLMGLGLMATAYLIWTLIDADRTAQAALLSHGKPPMTALLVYGGAGAMLGLPFLLPVRIARPVSVTFGMLKAVLLVASAYVLIGPLNLAIVEFTPKIYHPTLLETVPRLFKAICGVAVTAALLISFFRQLGGLPAVDYTGAPKVHLTPAQLYDLRKSRMQV